MEVKFTVSTGQQGPSYTYPIAGSRILVRQGKKLVVLSFKDRAMVCDFDMDAEYVGQPCSVFKQVFYEITSDSKLIVFPVDQPDQKQVIELSPALPEEPLRCPFISLNNIIIVQQTRSLFAVNLTTHEVRVMNDNELEIPNVLEGILIQTGQKSLRVLGNKITEVFSTEDLRYSGLCDTAFDATN